MAGIGFELRKHLREESYTDLFRAYLTAGLIGSGPWIISIGSMLAIGYASRRFARDPQHVTTFLATVTHLMSTSLIVSGFMQLMFTRFVADRLFAKKPESVAPNVLGALLVVTLVSGAIGTFVSATMFTGYLAYRVLLIVAFVVLCNLWVVSVLLSGMKAYRTVVAVFAGGYAITVGTAVLLSRLGLAGYLAGFCLGHIAMLFAMLSLVLKEYPAREFLRFEFLRRKNIFLELVFAGGLFNLAIWADKFVFWENTVTSDELVGPIRYSVVYDVPIFVAYLSLIPGMAVFFVRIETDFAEQYERFFTAVREGDTLSEIQRLRDGLVDAARAGVYDIFRIQGLTAAVLLLAAPQILGAFQIPSFYSYLFQIDVVAVGFQVVLLGIFTILFYLDYRKLVLALAVLFLVLNVGCSIASLSLGPRFYGFGFAVAVSVTGLAALAALSRRLDRLEYETFMR